MAKKLVLGPENGVNDDFRLPPVVEIPQIVHIPAFSVRIAIWSAGRNFPKISQKTQPTGRFAVDRWIISLEKFNRPSATSRHQRKSIAAW